MALTEKDKRNILNSVLNCVLAIADKKYQKRIWILGEGPECSSFADAVCDFFGDCDPMLEHYKDFGITEEQYQLLKKFQEAFRTFSDEHDWPQLFIDTSEWDRIVEMAKEVLLAFNYQKGP